jgi:chromosomal replication initiation ATPase DnaA
MIDIIRKKLTLTESTLIQIVEESLGFTLFEISTSSRRAPLVIARSILANLLRRETGCTFDRVGLLIGRDHSSVVKYTKDFKDNVKHYKEYKDAWELVLKHRDEKYSDISLKMMNTQIFQIETQLEILKEKQLVLIKNQ